jgi:hypothetical protein
MSSHRDDHRGRRPPPPRQAGGLGRPSGGAPQEGYSAASPSLDVSNTAGGGGASSARGYGTTGASRYWHPDADGETPR